MQGRLTRAEGPSMPERQLVRPVLLSIAAALVTMGLKATAFAVTGSVGLLSEAAESGINLFTALVAYFSLWYAAWPVDRSHTYGHEKIEYFSSGLEGFLILCAAAFIAGYAVHRLLVPETLQSLDIGVLIGAAAGVVNWIVARILLRVGREHQSIVLEADGHHLMTDVWTTGGVLIGLGLVWLSGKVWGQQLLWIDPVIALLMAGNITWTGVSLIWRSFNGLMDHALPLAEQGVIRQAIETQLEPGMTYHALRTRQAGSRRFADCHLLVPGQLSVREAHDVATRIEQAVRLAVPNMEVTVHIEPIEEEAAWRDSAMLRVEEEERTTEAQRTQREESQRSKE
jgi:cation diffusion facilitator family transporter